MRVYWAALHKYTNTNCVLRTERMMPKRRRKARVAVRRETGSSDDAHRRKNFFPKSFASGRRDAAFIETDRFCRSSHHHHHSSSSPLSRVRARARTNTLARDGSRASRRTRRRRAETGRDRAVGTGAFSRSRGPRSRRKRRVRGKAAPSLFAHTTAFSVDVRARDSPLDPLP